MRILKIIALSGLSVLCLGKPSHAAIPTECVNCSTIVEQVRSAAMQAKQLALEIKGWADVANTYYNAVENTVKLPMQAVNQVTGTYMRVTNLANRAGYILSSDAPLMQRLDMANGFISSASRLPGSTLRNAEWWAKRAEEQWEDDKMLLDLENERQELMTATLEFAASQGNIATGQMQMLQANHSAALIAAGELQRINQQLLTQWTYALEKEAEKEMKAAEVRRILTLQKGLGLDQSW